jgi:hypothetical protein
MRSILDAEHTQTLETVPTRLPDRWKRWLQEKFRGNLSGSIRRIVASTIKRHEQLRQRLKRVRRCTPKRSFLDRLRKKQQIIHYPSDHPFDLQREEKRLGPLH